MRIFSEKKKKDELVLVFDIGSSAVAGALFNTQASGIPKIIFSASEPIQIGETLDPDQLLSSTLKSLEIVTEKVYKSGLGAPSKVFCVLASPWYVSQTRMINFSKNSTFVFTEQFADSLIQKEVKIFEEEHLLKYNTGNAVRIVELKNIKTLLNGYESKSPINQKAQELKIIVFISIAGEQFLKKIEDTIGKHFQSGVIKFTSFGLASFMVVRDLFAKQDNFLLIDIGGEVTDISMIKKGTLRESISFPLGRNFLIRGISSGLGCTLSEASSMLSLFNDGHAEDSVNQNLSKVLGQLQSEWLKKFQESLANLSHDISVPASIYMSIDKDLENLFSQTIKTEQFSQYTLTESKFEVNFLNTEVLHGVATFEDHVIRDPFLITDSFYINSLLTKD